MPKKETKEAACKGTASSVNGLRKPVKRLKEYEDNKKWNLVRLKFLTDFMNELDLTTPEIAEKMHISRQSVYHWLTKDDAMLSSMYDLFTAFGYTLAFELVSTREINRQIHKGDCAVSLDLNGVQLERGIDRLSFVKTYLNREGLYPVDLAKKMNVGVNTAYHWFQKGDIFMSRVYKIAEALDCTLVAQVRPQSDGDVWGSFENHPLGPSYLDIKSFMKVFEEEAARNIEGNKAAGLRARKASMRLDKAFKEFRKVSRELK